MIDWWLLYSLNILALSMGIHTYVAHVLNQGQQPSSVKSNECLICKIKSCVITRKKVSDDVITFLPPSPSENEEDCLLQAKRINHVGRILFIVLTLIFNIVFWAIAAYEFSRPAEEYLE